MLAFLRTMPNREQDWAMRQHSHRGLHPLRYPPLTLQPHNRPTRAASVTQLVVLCQKSPQLCLIISPRPPCANRAELSVLSPQGAARGASGLPSHPAGSGATCTRRLAA